jgi:hypothetical protein
MHCFPFETLLIQPDVKFYVQVKVAQHHLALELRNNMSGTPESLGRVRTMDTIFLVQPSGWSSHPAVRLYRLK